MPCIDPTRPHVTPTATGQGNEQAFTQNVKHNTHETQIMKNWKSDKLRFQKNYAKRGTVFQATEGSPTVTVIFQNLGNAEVAVVMLSLAVQSTAKRGAEEKRYRGGGREPSSARTSQKLSTRPSRRAALLPALSADGPPARR